LTAKGLVERCGLQDYRRSARSSCNLILIAATRTHASPGQQQAPTRDWSKRRTAASWGERCQRGPVLALGAEAGTGIEGRTTKIAKSTREEAAAEAGV
jgi:hypothetical protein